VGKTVVNASLSEVRQNAKGILGNSAAGASTLITTAAGLNACLDDSITGALPRGHISGFTTSRPTTAAIAIGAGQARSDANDSDITLAASITKTQAAWAVGSSQGGLDSGSTYSTSTWYYVYVIKRSDTGVCDAIFSTSKVAPTYPTNYDSARRVGAFYVNSGGTIDNFIQYGDWFTWQPDRKQDLDTTSPGTTWTLLTISAPPIEGVIARCNCILRNNAPNISRYVGFHHGIGDAPTLIFAGEMVAENYYVTNAGQLDTYLLLMVNAAGQIRYAASSASTIRVFINTAGWIDSRGRG
jgi:hypothetical protein